MLRLWLNQFRPGIHVSLVDKPCGQERWLARTNRSWELAQPHTFIDHAALAATLDSLLASKPKSTKKWLPKPALVTLVLPDSMARYEVLPWTPSLMLDEELRQFAIERFEMMNQPVRNGWVVQAEWKTNGANTLAYALPHALLDKLAETVQRHGMVLHRVLPLSALAHYGYFGLRRRNELRIMQGGANTSALLYLDGKLITHLTETVRGSATESVRRLISRLQITELTPEIKLDRLALVGIDPVNVSAIAESNAPKKVRVLNSLRWGEWR